MFSLPGLILAAGFSSRMGRCKLTLPWKGKFLIDHVLCAARETPLSPLGIVVRPDSDPELLEFLAQANTCSEQILAPKAHLGQAESLKAGMGWLEHKKYLPGAFPDGVVVLLGDQPLVTAPLIRALITVFQNNPHCAVAPVYQGKQGNPVILPRRAFPWIRRLSGDTGARSLLSRLNLRLMSTNDTAAVRDIDTWEIYRRLQSDVFFAFRKDMV